MCCADFWPFITEVIKVCVGDGIIYSSWDEESIWKSSLTWLQPSLLDLLCICAVHDADFYRLWVGSHLIVPEDYSEICRVDVHLTSLPTLWIFIIGCAILAGIICVTNRHKHAWHEHFPDLLQLHILKHCHWIKYIMTCTWLQHQ